jgi:Pel9A-like, right handed beta helix region/Periplasmic copper-binding protein (NosD)
MVGLILLGAGVRAASATTYYVATSGADANAGTEEKPFRTIQKAADAAVAGDTVFVRAGIYNESVYIKNSGAPGNPIVLEGERGPNGEWKTIIDPGRPVKNWVPAPEIGWGVFKTTALNFNPYSMTVDNKQLLRISDRYMQGNEGFELLREAPNARIKIPFYEGEMNFWDGIGALYGHLKGVTYIRFRNGDDPNRRDVKAADVTGCIAILNRGNVVIRGFNIRGFYEAVKIEGAKAEGNRVENNYITSAHCRVAIRNGAARNIVDNNYMTQDYYGYGDPGAWQVAKADERSAIRELIYFMSKKTESDFGIIISAAGEGNEVKNNHIFSGQAGIYCASARKVNVHHNIIRNMSGVGITTRNGVVDGEFHDNLVFDCNYNIRIQNYNTAKDNERSEYYYRNLFYEPEGEGVHIFVHYLEGGWPGETKHPEIFFYQNSFSGGLAVIQPSAYAGKNGGMANTRFLNDIFSDPLLCRFCYHDGFDSIKGMIGAFDYNWVGCKYSGVAPAWFGKHNVVAEGQRLWPTEKMPDFRLTAGSPALEKGIDLSKPFTLEGKTFDPLPGMKPGYFSGPAPDTGALQYGQESPLISAVSKILGQR